MTIRKQATTDALLVAPATAVFAVFSAQMLVPFHTHFFEVAQGLIPFLLFASVLLGGTAGLFGLWRLILTPGLDVDSQTPRDWLSNAMYLGVVICGSYHAFLLSQVFSGLVTGYPLRNETFSNAVLALIALGPLFVAARRYYLWSRAKFFFWWFGMSSGWVALPWLSAKLLVSGMD